MASGHVGTYLDQLDAQLERMFAMLADVPESELWERPEPRRWSIGEVLDHTRLLDRSVRRIVTVAAPLLTPLGRMRRNRPFEGDIDDVFQRPSFPSQLGWLWSPRHTPKAPVPLEQLHEESALEHARLRAWYEAREEAVLGHIQILDPVVGWLNLVQTLRICVHHDAHHYRAIARTLGADWDARD